MEGPVPALDTRHPHCICFLVHLQVHLGKYTILILLIGVVLLWTHDRSRRTVCIPGLVHGYAGQLSALNTKQSFTSFPGRPGQQRKSQGTWQLGEPIRRLHTAAQLEGDHSDRLSMIVPLDCIWLMLSRQPLSLHAP